MCKLKEYQMQEWETALEVIFQHIDGDDSCLRTRARKIKTLLGKDLSEWKACDKAHTLYYPDVPENEPQAILDYNDLMKKTQQVVNSAGDPIVH